MRPYWLRVGPKSMARVIIRREGTHREAPRGEDYMRMETEIEIR